MMRRVLAALLLVGCGGPSIASVDAGPLPDADLAPATPADPLPAAMPMLGPCPTGWRAVTGADGATICDPWGAAGPSDACAYDEVHVPGTAGCARLGTACSADGWPSDLPTGRPIVWVDDGAAAGGDGSSQARAFTTIYAAMFVAPDAAVIAIATGRYDERQISLRPGQTLWGACVDGTRLTSSYASDDQMLIDASQAGVGLRNLSIDTPARFAIAISAGDVTIEDVVIEHAHGIGFYSMIGTSTLRNVAIRDTEPVSDRRLGDGVWLVGGSATLDHVVLDHNREYALYLSPGSSVVAHDLSARRTQPLATNGYYGHGIGVESAHLVLQRAAIEQNLETGIELLGAGRAELSDVVVRHTMAGPGGPGWGISAPAGATLVLDRVDVEDARGVGVIGDGAGCTIDAHDLVVRAIDVDAVSHMGGSGIGVQGGAHGAFSRVAVSTVRDTGVLITDQGTSATLDDLHLDGVAPASALRGYGVGVQLGASLEIHRAAIARATEVALGAASAGTCTGSDVVLDSTQPSADGSGGRGVVVRDGATMTLERARVDGGSEVGAVVQGSTLTLTDVTITDIASRMRDGLFGRGIDVEAASTVGLTRVHVLHTQDDGVFVAGMGTEVTASDLVIETTTSATGTQRGGIGLQVGQGAHASLHAASIVDSQMAGIAVLDHGRVDADAISISGVRAAACATTSCANLGGGFGVVSQGGSAITMREFVVRDATLCGVAVGLDASGGAGAIDLHQGTVSEAPVGACVQVPGYDVERLHDGVRFVDVTVPLQGTSYALPTVDSALSP